MTRPAWDTRAPFFRSAVQAGLLHRLVRNGDEWSDLDGLTPEDAAPHTVRRELLRLVDAGIVERRSDLRPHQFRLPSAGPLSSLLSGLVHGTLGVEDQLRERLQDIPDIVAAAIYGSWASASATPSSDIDVLVLIDEVATHFDVESIRQIEREVGRLIGRDVDVMVFHVAEARRKLVEGSGYLRSVLTSPRISLIGDVGMISGE